MKMPIRKAPEFVFSALIYFSPVKKFMLVGMTPTETHSAHVTPAGGNVFADLGFEAELAATLKADSQRIIEVQLATKRPE